MNKSVYLSSKPRYEILDGLRGVAAVLVVAYHILENYFGLGAAHPLNHGYLTVDFFFILSGFVIGYAYDDRWDRMSVWAFFKRRLVRLHPMVVFGTFFGTLMLYFQECPKFPNVATAEWWVVLLAMLWSFTMIPIPKSLDVRGWGETNPMNNPIWSLQWEYVANILYALVLRRLPKSVLALLAAVCGVFTVLLCLQVDVFGFLATRAEVMRHTVIGGWGLSAEHLQVGLTRLLTPFLCGLLLSRLGCRVRLRGGFWWCSLALAVLTAVPRLGGGGAPWLNGLFDAAAILVVFPLIVAAGAGSSVDGSRSTAVCRIIGELSYPLYLTHYPYTMLHKQWIANHPDAPASTHAFVSVCVFAMALMTAYATSRLYDQPVRRWLRSRLYSRQEGGAGL